MRAPADPMIRLAMLNAWLRREWKLALAAFLMAFVVVVASTTLQQDQSAPWTSQELSHLSRLPIPPDGVRPSEPLREPTRAELERLNEMQKRLREQLDRSAQQTPPKPKTAP